MPAEVITVTQSAQLFAEFNTTIAVAAAFFIATELHVNGRVNHQPGDYARLDAHLLKRVVRLPLVGPVGAALAGTLPNTISITIEDASGPGSSSDVAQQPGNLQNVLTHIFHPMLVNYFERHRSALEARFGSDRTNWPSSWQMGWLVRNGLSHGNRVYFERHTARPVSWGGVTLSPTDNGTQLVFGILNQADIILLLFEMEETLFAPLTHRAA